MRRMRLSTSATCRTEIAAVGSSISTSLAFGEPGAGDRHRLALAARHLAHEIARPRLRLQLLEELGRAVDHRLLVEHLEGSPALLELAAEEDVLRGGQVVGDARGPGRPPRSRPARASIGRWKWTALPSISIVAGGLREVAGDDLDERGLAGAVVAHQPDDLAGRDLEVDAPAAPRSRRSSWRYCATREGSTPTPLPWPSCRRAVRLAHFSGSVHIAAGSATCRLSAGRRDGRYR